MATIERPLRESGAAVLFALGFILLSTGLTAAIWTYSYSQLSTAQTIREDTGLDMALELGVQDALAAYNKNTTPSTGGVTASDGTVVQWTATEPDSSSGNVTVTITAIGESGDDSAIGEVTLTPLSVAGVAADTEVADSTDRPTDADTTPISSITEIFNQNLWATQSVYLTGTATGGITTEGSIYSRVDPGTDVTFVGPKTYTIQASDRCIQDENSDWCGDQGRVDTTTPTIGTNAGSSGRQVQQAFLNSVVNVATGGGKCDYTWSGTGLDPDRWVSGRRQQLPPGATLIANQVIQLKAGVHCLRQDITFLTKAGVARILAPDDGVAVFVPGSSETPDADEVRNFTLGSNALLGVTSAGCTKPSSSTDTEMDTCATNGASRVIFAGVNNFSARNHNNFVSATVVARDGCYFGNAYGRNESDEDTREVSFVGSAVCSWIRVDGSSVLPDGARQENQSRMRSWFPTVWTATNRTFG